MADQSADVEEFADEWESDYDSDENWDLDRNNPVNRIGAFLDRVAILDSLHQQSGVPKVYLAVGLLILGSVITIKLAGFPAFCNFVGLLYPAYMSFKTIERECYEGEYMDLEDDHIHWLMYWAVYGTFHVGETVAGPIFYRIPYYHVMKLLFLLWCFLPQTRGSTKVYNWWIRPLLIKHRDKIEDHLSRAQEVGLQATGEISRVGTRFMGEAVQHMAKSMISSLGSGGDAAGSASASPGYAASAGGGAHGAASRDRGASWFGASPAVEMGGPVPGESRRRRDY